LFNPVKTRGRLTKRAGAAALGGVAALATTGAIVASAAVPSFPDNIVIFPNRDMVVAEGFQDRIGELATVEVVRNDQVVGSTQAEFAESDDAAFEVNHPGGACWGVGAPGNLQVTPDIQPGDLVRIKVDGAVIADTTVQDGFVDANTVLSGNTLTVTGHIGAGVNRNQTEQRIVNPDLTPTDVARRDVRAVPGGLTPAPKGGYSSNLEFPTADTFKATYVFNSTTTAQIAARGGGERFMAWQEEDGDANRQGLTIAEWGEPGGPGMGGCPAGPSQVGAPEAGEAGVTRSADRLSARVDWVAAEAAAGSAAVTGYSVEAIAETATNGERKVLGRRTAANDTSVVIDGLTAAENYTFEVRSITGTDATGTSMSKAFPLAAAGGTPTTPDPNPDTTAPSISATPAGGADAATAVETSLLRLANTTSETGVEIYYTTDGSDPHLVDTPSETASRYTTAGIPITGTTPVEIRWAAFDRANNVDLGGGFYKAPATAALLPPANFRGTPAPGAVTLNWDAATGASVYVVQLYSATGTAIGTPREVAAPALTMSVPNLTGGTAYQFGIRTRNAAGTLSAESAKITVTPQNALERLTITRAQWRAGDFRVEGTSTAGVTTPASTVAIFRYSGNPASPVGAPINAVANPTANLVAAVAPATGTTFSFRLRNGNAPAANPGQIVVRSSNGTVSAPINTTNN
jgi:hypothetical protein